MALSKIVSGGQTGVDRGALDAALVAGFAFGGWCPADRGAEDGELSERYPLTPLPDVAKLAANPARQVAERCRARTLKNVQDSDGTVILYSGSLSGGTLLTQKLCMKEKKPSIALDAQAMTKLRAAGAVAHFVEEHGVSVLKVCRASLKWLAGGIRVRVGGGWCGALESLSVPFSPRNEM